MSYLRKFGPALAAGVCAVSIATAASAQTRQYDIPAGALKPALDGYARQSGRQLIYRVDDVEDARSEGAHGVMSADQALHAILAGSGFSARRDSSGALAVVPNSGRGPAASASGNGEAGALSNDDWGAGIADILVWGKRTQNLDIARSEDDAQPYVVFDRHDIETSQATSIENFLRTRVPQNAGFGGEQSQSTGNGKPFSSFNLRGLGSNQTLILVDGRRMANLANQNFAPGQADINGIPIGAIERIEILPSSAGGIYGGNAVGGVINIILRHDYRGVEISANYNDTFDFHAPNFRLDVNGGFALEGGKTTVTFGGAISRAGTLRVRDRKALIMDGIDLAYRNDPPELWTGYPPLGNGINIRSANGADLVLDPAYGGADLGSTITNLPLGYAGVASDGGAALIANAGHLNLDIPPDLQGLKRGLLTSPEMNSFNVDVRRKFSDLFDLYVDYSRFENRGLSYSANQIPFSTSLAANAPTNPFQQTIRISYPSPGLSYPYRSKSVTNTLAAGAIVHLPHKWGAVIEYHKNWVANRATLYQSVIDYVGQYCALVGVAPTSCPSFYGGSPSDTRPILDPLQAPIDFSPYAFTSPTFLQGPYRSTFSNPSLRVSGPLFRLAGGDATLNVAVQRESTHIERSTNAYMNGSTREMNYATFNPRTQSTTSEYGEIVLPLVGEKQHLPLLRALELRAAIRHDDYRTEGPPAEFDVFSSPDRDAEIPTYDKIKTKFQSTNYTLAGKWVPIEGIALRASYATGFLPPNVVQIASQSTVAPFGLGIPDPKRGSEIINYPVTEIYGSNSSLRPEKSSSLSFGTILTPFDGFRFSADYTLIKKRDEIGGLTSVLPYVLINPDLFPGRIVRADPAAGDPAGYQGKIVSLDLSSINLLKSTFKAVDFQADYTWQTKSAGSLRFYALASWQPVTRRQLVIGSPALNYSGNVDGPLKWQGNGGIQWSKDGWNVEWNTQFYDSYNIYTTQDTATASGAAYVADAIFVQGKARIPSQSYSDLYVSYAFTSDSPILHGLKISAGVQNIFNQKPPVIAIESYTQAGYSTYGDPRLRRFTLTVRKAFGGK